MFYKLLNRLLIVYIIVSCISFIQAHEHSHDESPSFKYSRQANDPKVNQDHHHHHHDGHDHHHHHHDGHDHHHHHHDEHDHHHHHHHHDEHDHHHHDGHDHHHHHHHDEELPKAQPTSGNDGYNIWLHSLGSTLLISAAPFFILYFVPLDNTEDMQPRLKTLLAFASGGLLGDAFLHLIPHAVMPHDHSHSHSHSHQHHHHGDEEEEGHSHVHDMWIGLWVLAGIITFLIVEKAVRILKIGHDHAHSHGGGAEKSKKEAEKKDLVKKKDKEGDVKKAKDKKKEKEEKPAATMEVAGYLNLAADFTHNFTDGLAIGASYLAGNSIGVVTTITILLHEVPHEIGDFAILIKSGCSKKKAMLLQLTTAVGALAGNVLALLGTSEESSPWILPFTAGGFIYIATVSVIPELLEHNTKLGQSLKEIFALLLGVGMMVLITLIE